MVETRNAGGPAQPLAERWTSEKRTAFLAHLAQSCDVRGACRKIGMTPDGLYRERQRNPSFRAAWQTALAQGYDMLELEMLRRAMTGVVRTVTTTAAKGKRTRTIEYPDTVELNLLALHRKSIAEQRAAAPAATTADDAEAGRRRLFARLDEMRARMAGEAE
jgi:hypothetical protein